MGITEHRGLVSPGKNMAARIAAEAAIDATDMLRATWQFGVPVDPVSIARITGLRVVDAPLAEDTMGVLIKQPLRDPTIMLNQNHSENRRRLTCGHQLGRFVRRSAESMEYVSVCLREALDNLEREPDEIYANEFADSLLMPGEDVRAFHGAGFGDLAMAMRFRVSREAMQKRLARLGLARF
jgi:Zn-dependent peptidase ImmA (M78 family)